MESSPKKISEFAVASLALGIVSFITLFGIEKPLLAIIFGALALKRIGKNGELKGRWVALAGLILGCLAFLVIVYLTIRFFPQLKQQLQK
jgi:hypothetical protein